MYFGVKSILFLSLISSGFVESINWIDDVTRSIIENWEIRNILIVEQFVRNESSSNRQIYDFRHRLMQSAPTIVCNVGDLTKTPNSSIDRILNENTENNVPATLYVIVSDVWSYESLKPTIESVVAWSKWDSKKFLLLLTSPKPRKKLRGLLEFAWREKLLDFTIIELVEPGIEGGSSYSTPILHRYNPFKREYTRRNWTWNEMLIEREALNMWGYPLKIGILHEPPMSFVKFDESNETPISLRGANINMIKLMAKRLNFTAVWIPIQRFPEIVEDPTPSGLFELMNSDKIDLLASMSPHHSNSEEYRIERTTQVFVDRMCPVVPIAKSVHIVPSVLDVCRYYLALVIMSTALWIPTYLLKFDRDTWRPINIVKLFLGSSWTVVPTKNAERLVFASVLLLSVLCSSTIFASSAKARFTYDKSASITTFQQLDDSGLTPLVSSFLYNKTFAHSEGFLPSLEKKSIPTSNINDCPFYAAKYKNVTCIMGERDMLLTMQANEDYRHRLKIVRPCFWSDTFGFLLGKSSPYTRYLNSVIYGAQTSGLIGKWYTKLDHIATDDWPPDLSEDDASTDHHDNANSVLVRELTIIVVLGFIASSLVFIGEVIVYRNY